MQQESGVGRLGLWSTGPARTRSQASCCLFWSHAFGGRSWCTCRPCPSSRPLEGEQGEKSPRGALHVRGQSVRRPEDRGGNLPAFRGDGAERSACTVEEQTSLGSFPGCLLFLCLSMGHNTNHLIAAFLLLFYLFASQACPHGIFTEVDTLCTSIPFWSYTTSLTANGLFRDPELPVWPWSAQTAALQMLSNCSCENSPVSEGGPAFSQGVRAAFCRSEASSCRGPGDSQRTVHTWGVRCRAGLERVEGKVRRAGEAVEGCRQEACCGD